MLYAYTDQAPAWLRNFAFQLDGTQLVEAEDVCAETDIASAEALGNRVAQTLSDKGARALLPAPV